MHGNCQLGNGTERAVLIMFHITKFAGNVKLAKTLQCIFRAPYLTQSLRQSDTQSCLFLNYLQAHFLRMLYIRALGLRDLNLELPPSVCSPLTPREPLRPEPPIEWK